jgi:hypothetical protein
MVQLQLDGVDKYRRGCSRSEFVVVRQEVHVSFGDLVLCTQECPEDRRLTPELAACFHPSRGQETFGVPHSENVTGAGSSAAFVAAQVEDFGALLVLGLLVEGVFGHGLGWRQA